jgi:solute carrier family 13 (sodium-dependent dicarboxylate transporter), member 2/3/5
MEILPSNKDLLKKGIIYLIAISIFFLGYNLAPNPMDDGSYTGIITFDSEDTTLKVEFSFIIDSSYSQSQDWVNMTDVNGDWELKVFYHTIVSGRINTQLKIEAQIIHLGEIQSKPQLDLFSGKVFGGEANYEFKAVGQTIDKAIFQFRILKFSGVMLGLLLMVSFLWLTEPAPVGAIALLIPIIIVVMSMDTAEGAFSQFFNPIIVLLFAGFLMAEALRKVELDKKIALLILQKVPSNPHSIIITLMVLAATFSMFMSNTATAAILIPLGITLLSFLEEDYPEYKRTVILAVSYSATMGGVGSLIGTPANLIAVQFLHDFDGTVITFVDWFFFGIPMLLIILPIIYLYLVFRFKPKVPKESIVVAKKRGIASMMSDQKKYGWAKGEPTNKDQLIVGLVFISVFTMWVTSEFHGLHVGVVAAMGATTLFLIGYLKIEDFNKINWNAIITFGGGLTLGTTMLRTGLAEYMAMGLSRVGAIPSIFILFLIAFATLLVTSIASNTASAAILIPIFMPLGLVLGISPVLIAVMIAITCSIGFATIIGTPPTMIAYSTGFFTVKQMFKIGSILDILGIFIVTIITALLYESYLEYVLM